MKITLLDGMFPTFFVVFLENADLISLAMLPTIFVSLVCALSLPTSLFDPSVLKYKSTTRLTDLPLAIPSALIVALSDAVNYYCPRVKQLYFSGM